MTKYLPKKISTRLLLSYSVPLLYLAVLGVSSVRGARKSFELQRERAALERTSYAASSATYHLVDAVQKVEGYILNPDQRSYVPRYSNSYQPFLNELDILFELAREHQDAGHRDLGSEEEIHNNEDLLTIVNSLREKGSRINNISRQIFEALEADDVVAATALISDIDAEKIDQIRQELQFYLEAELDTVTEEIADAQQRLRNVLTLGTPLAGLVTLISGVLLAQQIRRQMRQMVNVVEHSGILVTTSSTQIAASSRQLEESITEQLASTTEITATAKEIAATAEALTDTVSSVSSLSDTTALTATSGQQDLQRMAETMEHLIEATATISSKLSQIDSKAANISAVVTAITKVADQTNLLSLNAAIEAEKAGEYGAGFSVVAREIRRLADQTAIATLDIESIVKEMLSSISTGVMEMDKFSQSVEENAGSISQISAQMSQIIQQVQSLVPEFERVKAGMLAQAEGAQQIRLAMEQLTDGSQQTADSVKDTNQAIAQLSNVTQELQGEVAQFKLAV